VTVRIRQNPGVAWRVATLCKALLLYICAVFLRTKSCEGPGTPGMRDDESESGNAALRLWQVIHLQLLIDLIVLQVYTKNNPIYNPDLKNSLLSL
jgi:hypothetical protein